MEKIIVSVVMPAYNVEKYIEYSIKSVLDQTFSDWELLIVNDFSDDNTKRIVENFVQSDQRIRLFNLEKNYGVIYARNFALERAKGRFVAFLDADDIWAVHKLEIQIDNMMKNNQFMSYTNYQSCNEDCSQIMFQTYVPRSINFYVHHLTRYIGLSTVMIDTRISGAIRFPTMSSKYTCEDFYFIALLLREHGKANGVSNCLTTYRLVPNSRSFKKFKSARSIWAIMREYEKLSLRMSILFFISYAQFSILKFAKIKFNKLRGMEY
jgi:teichuronic acid biosynthesis glycosyltransferase TuaG